MRKDNKGKAATPKSKPDEMDETDPAGAPTLGEEEEMDLMLARKISTYSPSYPKVVKIIEHERSETKRLLEAIKGAPDHSLIELRNHLNQVLAPKKT